MTVNQRVVCSNQTGGAKVIRSADDFFVMYYLYILYSESSDLFYVGTTDDYARRVIEHNESNHNTFTSKHRPWKVKAVFECGTTRSDAMAIKQFIKKQKSKQLTELLCRTDFVPTGKLAQLVKVPDIRD